MLTPPESLSPAHTGQVEEAGIGQGGNGDNSLTVWTLVLSCEGVNVSVRDITTNTYTHSVGHTLARQKHLSPHKEREREKKNTTNTNFPPVQTYAASSQRCAHAHTYTLSHPPTIAQSSVRTSWSPTVKVYCSSCHVKSCCTVSVHVKKAFL